MIKIWEFMCFINLYLDSNCLDFMKNMKRNALRDITGTINLSSQIIDELSLSI